MFEKVKIEILLLLLSMLVCMSLKIIISFLFLYFRCERNFSCCRLSSDVSDLLVNDEVEELIKGIMRNMRMLWCEFYRFVL